eukprot:COSAG05_NODE_16728_length_340_cov_0.647303_1_plen_94_part_10
MSLRDFPFDQQTIWVELASSQQFATKDGTIGINGSDVRPYRLRHVGGPTGTGLNLMTWTGDIVEWDLHVISTLFVCGDGKAVIGGETTRLTMSF